MGVDSLIGLVDFSKSPYLVIGFLNRGCLFDAIACDLKGAIEFGMRYAF